MQQIIQRITQKLIDRLPENDQYYRLDELREWEFPPYLVQRIKIELERNLAESMMIPKTDWANTQSDAVLDAWQQFVSAIRAEARLPASYGKTVIETAVADVLEMLVQPCQTIPDVIFGSDEKLSKEKVKKRLEAVVVYRHFARFIVRYMDKKELDELKKSRCEKVIREADKRMTKRYSPLNWAQMLDTLFKLLGGHIDSELLRLFYEDKDHPRIARHFDLMTQEVSRAGLIEELSSPDLLNLEGYEDEQSTLFEDQLVPDTANNKEGQDSDAAEENEQKQEQEKAEKADDTGDDNNQNKEETPSSSEEDQEEVNIASEFVKQVKDKEEDSEKSDDSDNKKPNTETKLSEPEESKEKKIKALNDAFSGQMENKSQDKVESGKEESDEGESAVETKEVETGKNESVDSASNLGSSKTENEEAEAQEKEQEAAAAQDKAKDKASSRSNGQKTDEEDQSKSPMWMRYMSDEDMEEYREEQQEDDEEYAEEPIIDLTKEDASDDNVEELAGLLEGDREFFIEEIFGGSERAFDSAVEDIAGYSSWSDVSKYIEKDIFKRNLVDVYSEAAVDFTDQLQNYFLEKENRN